MTLVHYYVHGRGLGHATRSAAVIASLSAQGYTVKVFAGEDAFPLLTEVAQCEPISSLSPFLGWRTPIVFFVRLAKALRTLRQDRPKVVISDSDLPSLLAAKLSGLPGIAVGHGLITACCQRPLSASQISWDFEARKSRQLSRGSTHQVCVNFLPLIPLDPKKTLVAAPLLTADLKNENAIRDPDAPVLAYFRDSNAERVLEALTTSGRTTNLFTQHQQPVRTGIKVFPVERSSFLACLLRTPAVVSSAGSQLMSECLLLGIPQFALYDSEDHEQRLNVEMLISSGLGFGCTFQEFTPERLIPFFDQLHDFHKQIVSLPSKDVSEAIVELLNSLN